MNASVKHRKSVLCVRCKHRNWAASTALWGLLVWSSIAHAQAKYTASRAGDLQIGAGASFGQSTNTQLTPSAKLQLPGFALYSTFDFRYHFGAEVDFHQLNANDGSQIYERTYEVGGRYVRHYGLFSPYVKGLYGRGVYNYAGNVANLAYNVCAGGAGVDVHLRPAINVRFDYEYQTWMSFPRGDLHPNLITVGAAYHFH